MLTFKLKTWYDTQY